MLKTEIEKEKFVSLSTKIFKNYLKKFDVVLTKHLIIVKHVFIQKVNTTV